MQPAIRFRDVVREYAEGAPAVNGVSFDVEPGAMAVIVGPSGCGKTTLLKTVNRLGDPTSGRVFVDGVDTLTIDAVSLRRRIGYAIQNVGLFPHMTVAGNVAVVPQLLGWARDRIDARVDELLDLVHLPPADFRARFPRALSGGQQQRVGLARALAGDPSILLMDEPFGAVDAIERSHLQAELLGIQRRLRKTVLFVTHDVDEALRLADVIVVMRAGRVEQAGTPADVLLAPVNSFVSDLLGAGDALRRLSAIPAGAAMASDGAVDGPRVARTTPLREVLSLLIDSRARAARVVDADGGVAGSVTLDGIIAAARSKSEGGA
ncbi:MAG TPA: ABC transporter ATP-binding protein [Candidatus Eremiobacteraceae bacterium]|nr:ABC transporter ATP-binding protein [Candidatus Eremiobacteraceae bacterium]